MRLHTECFQICYWTVSSYFFLKKEKDENDDCKEKVKIKAEDINLDKDKAEAPSDAACK